MLKNISSNDNLTKSGLFNHFCIIGQDNYSNINEITNSNLIKKAPIINIEIIFPKLFEKLPENYEIITTTNSGTSANLFGKTFPFKECYIIFERGYHKPPIIDIGIIDKTKNEQCLRDSKIITRTRYGHSANLSNSINGKMYLVYKRAPVDFSLDNMVVVDICIINGTKKEKTPGNFFKIPKSINKGILNNEIFICYRKEKLRHKELTFNCKLLDSFPPIKEINNICNIPMFCMPEGSKILCWSDTKNNPTPFSNTFILTEKDGSRIYGITYGFYEKFYGSLNNDQLEKLELKKCDDFYIDNKGKKYYLYNNISICFISNFPYFDSFYMILQYIKKMVDDDKKFCIEKFLSNLLYKTIYPVPMNPHFKLGLGEEEIFFNFSNFNDFPICGSSYVDTLRLIGPMNLLILVISAINEKNIIFHSVRSHLLTIVCESITSLMFPFFWDFPYIPYCPFNNFIIFECPCPYIVGVDSKYFDDIINFPKETICFGLDTNTISLSKEEIEKIYNSIPLQCAKYLRVNLTKIYNELMEEDQRLLNLKYSEDPLIQLSLKKHLFNINNVYNKRIKEIFLRFMCNLLVGYEFHFILSNNNGIELNSSLTKNIYDIEGFISRKPKIYKEFYKKLCSTQAFVSLIQDKISKSDRSKYYTFFNSLLLSFINDNDEQLLEDEGYDDVLVNIPLYHVNIFEKDKERDDNENFPQKFDDNLFVIEDIMECIQIDDDNSNNNNNIEEKNSLKY
ncbi:Calmodulin-binding protein related to a Rab3 GDP/GTP exchange protein [Strongyloides ratti]|uniref:Calmodulin-binding protein related to a Rab3 GDP/GTP exchange protein n=1 Tax=Strongyloides ratti TaxID=34506 RepID=A0A090LIT1_STRRB|nr:Calmodulin-binding protein related to a Rab3 GDP/GTP exchange protein [Strongyloides ratti]CEF69692.1 Calmodulin-binding protein related to a Rab3 GDP/GTP exchange protein [Strongyloides ratti]